MLALIAWPESWNEFDKGLKSNTKWTARSCPVFTHKNLGPQYLVKSRDVDKTEFMSNVRFIYINKYIKKKKKKNPSKPWSY